MSSFYSVLIDISILVFFGALYYYLQRRRIIKNSSAEIRLKLEKLIFDIHSYLDKKDEESYYNELNNYAEKLEQLVQSNNILSRRDELSISPKSLPSNLKDELESIKNLF